MFTFQLTNISLFIHVYIQTYWYLNGQCPLYLMSQTHKTSFKTDKKWIYSILSFNSFTKSLVENFCWEFIFEWYFHKSVRQEDRCQSDNRSYGFIKGLLNKTSSHAVIRWLSRRHRLMASFEFQLMTTERTQFIDLTQRCASRVQTIFFNVTIN